MKIVETPRYQIQSTTGNEVNSIWKIIDLQTGKSDYLSLPRTMDMSEDEALDYYLESINKAL